MTGPVWAEALPAAPAPGMPVATFEAPIPGEQEATRTAVDYGWLIALILLAAGGIALVRFILGSWAVRVLLALIGGGVIVYFVMKGSS